MKTPVAVFGLLGLISASMFATESAPPASAGPVSRPCRIIESVPLRYPLRMLNAGIAHGTATLMLAVDGGGRVTDVLAIAYSHECFAKEALQTVQEWKFEPAIEQGRPITTLLNLSFEFEANGLLVIERRAPLMDWEKPEGQAYQAQDLQNLDAPPQKVKVVPPTYPEQWAASSVTGQLVVDFFIDETGRPRMASCPEGSNPQLAGIALAAIEKWEFTPPTVKGKPVLVHARQPFSFGGKS